MATTLLHFFFVALVLNLSLVAAQNCYYPDGSLSTEGVAACSSQGGACCPLNWQCMSNGLCYLESEGYYGRYSCTDRTWESPDCPQFCKTGDSAPGNEAVLWCPNGDFCCDGDRVSGNCCKEDDAVRFTLPDPTPIQFISTVPSPTPVSSYAGNSPTLSSSSSPSADSSTTSSSMSTVTHESLTTGSNGGESTVTQVVTIGPSAVEPTASPAANHHSSNTGMIAGLATGIPVFFIIAGTLLFFFVKHMRKSNELHQPPDPPPSITEVQYKNIPPGTHALEADGSPIAPGRTKSGRTSELYGSDAYMHSPNPSISTSISGPPQYSNSQASPEGRKETPGMSSINEEPAELWSGPVYRAYRPPPEHPDSSPSPSSKTP